MTEPPSCSGRYAAIDIGTVTCRLLVADVDAEGRIREVFRDRDIANLGVGVDSSGRLAADAVERVGETIDRFASEINELQVQGAPVRVRAIATSAARDASNSDELVARLSRAGIELEIVPGEVEAALSFAGATSAFPGEKAVVVDVGGGSTEIIAGMAGEAPSIAHSFQMGCRRVTERFFEEDPPGAALVERASVWIAAQLVDYMENMHEEGYIPGHLIAVAGTATSVVSMREKMEVYDANRVHGAVVTRSDLDDLVHELQDMSLADREKIVGLDPQRAPVILAGLVILQQIMDIAPASEFTVSECDILHGIIADMVKRQR